MATALPVHGLVQLGDGLQAGAVWSSPVAWLVIEGALFSEHPWRCAQLPDGKEVAAVHGHTRLDGDAWT